MTKVEVKADAVADWPTKEVLEILSKHWPMKKTRH